jgi:hypothetical protein
MLQLSGLIFGIIIGRFVGEVAFKQNYSWSNIALGLAGLVWLIFLSTYLFSALI